MRRSTTGPMPASMRWPAAPDVNCVDPHPRTASPGSNAPQRHRQIARAAGGGLVAVALVVVGVVAFDRRDSSDIVTSDSTVDTPADTTDPDTSEVPDTSAPDTSTPSAGAPSVVYTGSGSVADVDRVQTLVDPSSGATIGTEPIDSERSRLAQEALPSGGRSSADLGTVSYDFLPVGFDGGTLATDIFPDVDLCRAERGHRAQRGRLCPARSSAVPGGDPRRSVRRDRQWRVPGTWHDGRRRCSHQPAIRPGGAGVRCAAPRVARPHAGGPCVDGQPDRRHRQWERPVRGRSDVHGRARVPRVRPRGRRRGTGRGRPGHRLSHRRGELLEVHRSMGG